MHNSKCQCHMAACCTYHRSAYFLSAKQEPYKKAYLLTKNIEEYSWENMEPNEPVRQKLETHNS